MQGKRTRKQSRLIKRMLSSTISRLRRQSQPAAIITKSGSTALTVKRKFSILIPSCFSYTTFFLAKSKGLARFYAVPARKLDPALSARGIGVL